jgi:putative peptidoglycan lipid II flippase
VSLLKSISQVGSLTLVSRVLGFVRDVLFARFLGAGMVSDVFFVAFKLPNFFRRLFAEGAFSAAFVPIFCGLLGEGTDEEKRKLATRFAEDSLSVLLAVLLVFTALIEVVMPWAMLVLAPGFRDDPAKFALAVEYTRLTFPYLMLISVVALMSGVLNGLHRFAFAAAAPILLNAVLIGAVLFSAADPEVTGARLSVGVAAAGVAQLVWMMWGLARAGFSLRLVWPKVTPRVKELGRVMLPVALGAGAMQVNLVVDIILASFLPEGSLSYLYYADRLNQLPIGVVGIAVGTVLLPVLTRALAANDLPKALHQQNRALEAALFLTLPAALALVAIPHELIAVMFQRGAFDAADTMKTAWALMAYAAGLPAYVLVKALAPGYFARKDTKTPVKIGVLCLGVNFIANIILMQFLAHVGLALGTAIAAWVNVALLYRGLRTRGHFEADARLKRRALGMTAAAAAMALVLWAAAGWLQDALAGPLLEAGPALGLLVATGLGAYLAAAKALGAFEWAEVRQMLGLKA